MEGIVVVLFVFSLLFLAVWGIKALIRNATHVPTWEGIIISALLGMLPLYLILCFLGIMGESRKTFSNDGQSHTGSYAEEMSKRYAYNNSAQKSWLKYLVVGFVIMCLFYFGLYYYSNKREGAILPEITTSDYVAPDEQVEETTPITKKELPAPKQEAKQKKTTTKKEKPLCRTKEDIESQTIKKQKSTLELLEERTHTNVVKQAKEAGVSTEGSTTEILERITHASVVKQAKEAGVSTEGSTSEILERITRKYLERDM